MIIRNLPADHKYELLSSGSFEEGEGWNCENCGRYITHWCAVIDDTNHEYLVGTECINTVLKFDATQSFREAQILATANSERRMIKKFEQILKNGGHKEIHYSRDGSIPSYNFYRDETDRSYCGYMKVEIWDKYHRKGIKK